MIFSTVTQLCIQLQNTSITLRWDFKLSLQQSLHPASSGVGPTPPLIAPPAPPPPPSGGFTDPDRSQPRLPSLCSAPPTPVLLLTPQGAGPKGLG